MHGTDLLCFWYIIIAVIGWYLDILYKFDKEKKHLRILTPYS